MFLCRYERNCRREDKGNGKDRLKDTNESVI